MAFYASTAVALGLTLLGIQNVAHAATISARSPSFTDVSSAIASAREGDTVLVPSGTATWTSTVDVRRGITLQGAGVDKTIVIDDVLRRNQFAKAALKEEPSPAIQFAVLRGPGPFIGRRGFTGPGGIRPNSGGAIFRISLKPDQTFRLTGFTFRQGSVTASANYSININGKCPSVRVDHCFFDQLYCGANIFFNGWHYGVVDHCRFDIRPKGGGASVRVYHTTWGDQPSGWGSWAEAPYFGSEKFIFVEDNVVNNLGRAPERGNIDGQHGGRFVVRHNTFNNCNIFYHGSDNGTGGPQYNRGTRAVEIYNNTFNSTHKISAGQDRGGPLIWHDNTYTGDYGGGMVLAIYRLSEHETKGFFGADGTSPWDCNATEPDGTHVEGHMPYTYATGTHIGQNDYKGIVVSENPWKLNQWVGNSATNTNRTSPYFHGCNRILSNTSNTLTFACPTTSLKPKGLFNTGDTFAIHKVLIVIDQPGRGKGDLIVGDPAGSTNIPKTGWPRWPHQVIEPCYSWNNKLNGANLDFGNRSDPSSLLVEGVDYYNSTPMPGYKPYIYPHPLLSGGSKE